MNFSAGFGGEDLLGQGCEGMGDLERAVSGFILIAVVNSLSNCQLNQGRRGHQV